MTFGISPESIDNMSTYEMEIYIKLIPLYFEFQNNQFENSIKKSISELLG